MNNNSLTKKINKTRFKAVIAVYLVLFNNKQQVLLLRRKNTGYCDGCYSLVAGHVDGNEPVLDAMIREAHEEAGITLDKKDLQVSSVIHRKTSERETIEFFITATQWTGEIYNAEPHKCDDLSFFDLNTLPDNLIDYVRVAIDSVIKKVPYVEYGW